VVFGTGNEASPVIFVGEGPGEQEDLSGIPFVGPAGQLFDKYLAAFDIRRESVYIANIVKCRPPGNRDPLPEEQDACIDWLRNQMLLMRPKIIVALGRIAAARIMNSPDFKITKERGIWVERKGFHMMATYHPSYLLRNPAAKEQAYADFKSLCAKMDELGIGLV
jgi:DNA polymerase